jgi:signal transduction histidine kinase
MRERERGRNPPDAIRQEASEHRERASGAERAGEAASERRWYRSLYWRIALGYIALLAVLLLIQTAVAIWMTDRVWGRSSRTPLELAETVADDLAKRLSTDPAFDIEPYLRDRYGSGYQPFVVVIADRPGGVANRDPVPPNLFREARRRLVFEGSSDRERGGRGGGRPFAQFADILVNGARVGIVAVPSIPPSLAMSLRVVAPTLALIGIALLAAGAAIVSLLIFRPTHRRLRELERAAGALGEGRTDVRANEAGGDEVSGLSAAFNRMASDLEARAAALAESDRARRQLLADVSHELMTPLSAIRGYVETLGMPELTIDQPTRSRYLEIVHQETHTLEAIIGDLLDLARLEGGGDTLERDAVLVDDLFRRVADRHRPALLERGVTLTIGTADGTPLILGDADRLEQALQNVAANAIRHTPDGGTVALHAQPAADRVRITVADSGPGIPPEHLPHIFDRFYKADAARAGTRVPSGSGLGLSIVRAIVVRHGGEVRAMNRPSGGALFEILLPAIDAKG